MISFAMNWLFGQDSVTGYHLVNITLHILTALLLYRIIVLVFQTPAVGEIPKNETNGIALFAAVFWAVNPIHTQAVTYIVQRMTILAALFYLLGVYCYLRGKMSGPRKEKIAWFTGCAFSYFAAMGSKENACLLPLALFLIDFCFFQQNRSYSYLTSKGVRSYLVLIFCGLALPILLFVLMEGNPIDFLSRLYDTRPFTLTERLLTETRVIILYLTQIFYPNPARLSIAHNLEMSQGLMTPWTTLPAILLLVLLIIVSIRLIRHKPVWGFALLFFFLNHIVESSVLPLEPIFEHRNYLPSMFLFLPVAMVFQKLLIDYETKNKILRGVIIVFFVLALTGFGVSTHARNLSWQTEETLWTDALRKAPSRPRPYVNLAAIYKKKGQYEIALALYEKSLRFEDWQGQLGKANTYNNIGNLYLELRQYAKASEYFKLALSQWPEHQLATYNLAVCRQWQSDYQASVELYEQLVTSEPGNPLFLRRKALVSQKMGIPEESLSLTRQALQIQPHNPDIILQLANLLSLMDNFERAQWYYQRLTHEFPAAIKPHMHRIMNSLRWQNGERSAEYTTALFNQFPRQVIMNELEKVPYDIEQEYFINRRQLADWFKTYTCERTGPHLE